MSERFEPIIDDRKVLVEVDTRTGIKYVHKKDNNGQLVNNGIYIKTHKEDFAQPGSKIYRQTYGLTAEQQSLRAFKQAATAKKVAEVQKAKVQEYKDYKANKKKYY